VRIKWSNRRRGYENVRGRRGDIAFVVTAALLGVVAGELVGWAILPLARALLLGDGEAAPPLTSLLQ